jgi:3-dehydroquinate dehydratase/shikimate dehydrogenase
MGDADVRRPGSQTAGLPQICVALAASTPAEMAKLALAALADAPFLEIRLDSLEDPGAPETFAMLARFHREHPGATVIATCRRTPNGGHFDGTLEAELDILTRAVHAGCQIIDLELESAEQASDEQMTALKNLDAALIVSYHNFHGMDPLDAMYARVARFQPQFAKLVPTALRLEDSLTMLRFLEHNHEQAARDGFALVGMCMGQCGVPSRVLGVRSGSAFTFAASASGGATAPGQATAGELRDSYRIGNIGPNTRIYGVAGSPTTSSLSPRMLNMAFAREAVDAVYLPLETATMEDLLHVARELPLHGLSVTMPHKQAILPILDWIDPLAAAVGAVNTVVGQQDGSLHGFNTDIAGIVAPLERRMSLQSKRVLVLGAGGAARAAVFGLVDRGAEVTIVNRTPETARSLAMQAGASMLLHQELASAEFDVVVNATSIGMRGQPATTWLEPEKLRTKLIFDLVYNPLETPLLQFARQRGIEIIAGIEMFVAQGARQFELWTGLPAPLAAMQQTVLEALTQRQANQS